MGSKFPCGVASVVKESCNWAVRPIALQGPCLEHYLVSRLQAIQLCREKGKRSHFVYCVCGHAGARWESDMREMLHAMLCDIFQDAVTRGGVPIMIVGEYNIEIAERRRALTYRVVLRVIGQTVAMERSGCTEYAHFA